MVSSSKAFDWMDNWDRHPSMNSALRPSKLLWLSDQQAFVDQLIKKIDELFGDPVIRIPSEIFDDPQTLATTVLNTAKTSQISEVIVIGHSYFQSRHQLSQVDGQFEEIKATNTITSRLVRKHQLDQLAKHRLLEVTNNLLHTCDTRKHDLLISPLFFRVEDRVVCCYNPVTNRFEAIEGGAMLNNYW